MEGRVMTLEQMIKALAEKIEGLKALQTAAMANDATEDATKALEVALDGIEKLEKNIKLAEKVAEHEKSQSVPADTPVDGPNAPAQAKSPDNIAEKLGVIMGGMLKEYKDNGAKGPEATLRGIEKLGYGQVAQEFSQNKSMTSLTGATGGFSIAENFNREIIGLLYPQSSFMSGNPRIIPMPDGNYRQSKGATGVSAVYRGEGDDIAIVQPTLAELSMSAKLLSAVVPVTNQLIRYSLGSASDFARNDLSSAMSIKMDTAAYLGTGAGDEPTGIMIAAGITSFAAAAGVSPTAAVVDAEARQLISVLTRYPLLGGGAAWRMSVRTFGYLSDMRDGNGNKIYPELENSRWKGYPIEIAGTYPENLGAGTNETYLALISFPWILVGESKGLELAISDEASIGPAATAVSMFSTDQTAIRATMEHDFGSRYEEAVGLLTAVQWGG